jgi:cobalt-zinc-cadmium efflux system membrane fusion protein
LGDDVKKGDVLGAIQSREAAQLAEARGTAQARLARARPAFERQKSLMEAGATARQDYDAAEAEWRVAAAGLARANAAAAASGLARDGVSLDILSPVSGRITAASAVLGAYVVAGSELFRVADPAKLEIQAALPSTDAQRVAVGDAAEIDTQAGPISARVRAVTPDIGLQSRAATVVLTPLRPGSLQPGQLLAVRILVQDNGTGDAAILVPDAALQKMNGEDAIFVRTKDGFETRAVTLGAAAGGMTEIRSGLRAGEEIAAANSFLIKSELEKGSAGDDE